MQTTRNTQSLAGFLLINNSICDNLLILRRCLCPIVCILPDNHLTHHAGGLYDIQAGGQGPAVKAGLGFECGQCYAAEGEDAASSGRSISRQRAEGSVRIFKPVVMVALATSVFFWIPAIEMVTGART